MKIVYEDNEKQKIKDYYDNNPFMNIFDNVDPDREFGLSFKITNSYLAQHILLGLLYDTLNNENLPIIEMLSGT